MRFQLLCLSVVMCLAVGAGAAEIKTSSDHAALDKANPINPLPKVPLGIDRKFSDLKQPPTPERVRLGRWLFFEPRMSKDDTISCATCHRPENAFSEPTPTSTGINGQVGGRKAPSVINATWSIFPHTFWDGRGKDLEDQAKGPITNPIEMGMPDHDFVVGKIAKITSYGRYFKEAFGDDVVNIDRIAKAIADYERTRLSGNSPWDRWQAKPDADDPDLDDLEEDDDGPKFSDGKLVSAKVKLGDYVFFNKAQCNQCHLGYHFTDSLFHNLGVGWDPQAKKLKDIGRYEVTKKDEDKGAFKTPGLRETTKHAPYMHDGSVKTLREVVELYNRGGEKNPHLSPKMKALNLTDAEIDAVVAFMEALDGEGYLDEAPAVFPR